MGKSNVDEIKLASLKKEAELAEITLHVSNYNLSLTGKHKISKPGVYGKHYPHIATLTHTPWGYEATNILIQWWKKKKV